jgi:hypothetical protein
MIKLSDAMVTNPPYAEDLTMAAHRQFDVAHEITVVDCENNRLECRVESEQNYASNLRAAND